MNGDNNERTLFFTTCAITTNVAAVKSASVFNGKLDGTLDYHVKT